MTGDLKAYIEYLLSYPNSAEYGSSLEVMFENKVVKFFVDNHVEEIDTFQLQLRKIKKREKGMGRSFSMRYKLYLKYRFSQPEFLDSALLARIFTSGLCHISPEEFELFYCSGADSPVMISPMKQKLAQVFSYGKARFGSHFVNEITKFLLFKFCNLELSAVWFEAAVRVCIDNIQSPSASKYPRLYCWLLARLLQLNSLDQIFLIFSNLSPIFVTYEAEATFVKALVRAGRLAEAQRFVLNEATFPGSLLGSALFDTVIAESHVDSELHVSLVAFRDSYFLE